TSRPQEGQTTEPLFWRLSMIVLDYSLQSTGCGPDNNVDPDRRRETKTGDVQALFLGRMLPARIFFRRRMLFGVISTSSSSLMNSTACSRLKRRGGISRMASSAVDARMLVCFFSLVMFTSMSLVREFSPMIIPS